MYVFISFSQWGPFTSYYNQAKSISHIHANTCQLWVTVLVMHAIYIPINWLAHKGHEKQVFFLQILDRFYEIMPGDAAYFPKYFSRILQIFLGENLLFILLRITMSHAEIMPQHRDQRSTACFFIMDKYQHAFVLLSCKISEDPSN